MATREDALRRAAALLRLANSNNPHEAALAAQRAQEILDRYDLDRAALEMEGAMPAEPDEDIVDFGSKGAPLDSGAGKSNRERWTIMLAAVIAHANHVYLYTSGPAINLVGRASDVNAVRYLYSYLFCEVVRLTDRDGQGCGRTWRNNYRMGVVDTIGRALREAAKRAADAWIDDVDAHPAVPRERALVLVQTALKRREERFSDVCRWVKKNKKLHTVRRPEPRYDQTARAAGREAGKEIRVGGARAGLTSGRAS